jgi:hypothetical protein
MVSHGQPWSDVACADPALLECHQTVFKVAIKVAIKVSSFRGLSPLSRDFPMKCLQFRWGVCGVVYVSQENKHTYSHHYSF